MKINCIIVDDEPLAIGILESYLAKLDHMRIVSTHTNVMDALPNIKEKQVDVVFLDIDMPRLNGLEFLRSLKQYPHIIITTAYREYALESYELDILDYLVKPIPFHRFLKSINKLSNRLKDGAKEKDKEENVGVPMEPHIFLKIGKKMIKILLSEILYIESLKDYVKVCTETGNHIAYKSLSGIISELPSKNFARVHKSYAVAIDKVDSVSGDSIEIGTKNIPIGRIYLKQVKEQIIAGNLILPKNQKRD